MDGKRGKGLVGRLRERAGRLWAELRALRFAMLDPRAGPLARAVAAVALAYALSPIDLIPDFIPVLGLLDDLIILPALIALALRLVPPDVMAAARERAAREPGDLKASPAAAVVVVLIWLALLFAVVRAFLGSARP